MALSTIRLHLTWLLCAVLPSTTSAQWSSDPALNLSIADGVSDQVLPKVAPTSDGGCYVSWYDGFASGFDVRLQRLDASGVEQWAHGGVLVKDRGFSSVQDYSLDVDAVGMAVLAFRDDSGTGVQITVNRVTTSGVLLWGASGVQVTSTTAFVAAPKVTGASNGDLVVAWTESNLTRVMRLLPNGGTAWAAPVDFAPPVGNYSASDLHATGDDVILSIVHQTGSSFMSPKHLRAQKLDPSGAPLWGATPLAVFDGGSLQVGNFPVFITDGSGGAVFSWYSTSPLQCYAQRILANGSEAFPHNGSAGSSDLVGTRVSPSVAFDAVSSQTYLFWEEQNGAQSLSGLSGQKFDAIGSAQWGATGSALIPLSGTEINWVRTLITAGGAYVFWHEAPGFGNHSGHGAVIDSSGAFAVGPTTYASTPSNKTRLAAALLTSGDAVLAWGDDRVDAGDVLMQNMRPDGSLGGALPYSQYCFGIACPCGNDDASAGCANGLGSGALLAASGSASAMSSSLVLTGSSLPANQPGLYFQGVNALNAGNGLPFGDGLRCAGGSIVRLQVRVSDGLGNSMTSSNIALGGAVVPGDTLHYQLWYRDPIGTVCGSSFNLTNGVTVTWWY